MREPNNFDTAHRPWEIPQGQWSYYQEWNQALFLHWEIEAATLKELVPENLEIDQVNGKTWISLVAFTMQKIRPRSLPAIQFISDFHEVNVRAYVSAQNKAGVYFLNIEAQKYFSAKLSKLFSGLPYEKTRMDRKIEQDSHYYHSINRNKNFHLEAKFKIGPKIKHLTQLDRWLTERYCLYLQKNHRLYRYEIHHLPWELYTTEVLELKTDYTIGKLSLNRKPDLVHYSTGVKSTGLEEKKHLFLAEVGCPRSKSLISLKEISNSLKEVLNPVKEVLNFMKEVVNSVKEVSNLLQEMFNSVKEVSHP